MKRNKLFVPLFALSLFGLNSGVQAQEILDWAVTMGGTNAESVYAMATDDDGNVYTTGYFYGKVDFNTGTAPADTFFLTSSGGGNVFVTKLDASGKLLWARKMGGTISFSADEGYGVDVDNDGNVYITGRFYGKADFNPSANAADTFYMTASGGAYGHDIFVAKLDKDGGFVWARQFNGYGDQYSGEYLAHAIVVDRVSGDVYTTGYFTGRADFNPGTAAADTFFLTASDPQYGQDMFVSKLDSAGRFVWAKRIGGSSTTQGRSIALDPSGNVLTTGYYYNRVDFNPGTGAADTFFMRSANNGQNIFVLKLDGNGAFKWARSMGADNGSGDIGSGIATDAEGSVYTTGYFSGSNADFGAATFNTLNYKDIFVSKIDSAGNFVWARHMGGDAQNGEEGRGIAVNKVGDVYITGDFRGTVDFNIAGGSGADTGRATGYHPTSPIVNNPDAFIVKLNADGDYKWLRTFGSAEAEVGFAIATGPSGSVYAGGSFRGVVDFDPPSGPSHTPLGQSDAFVLKLICGDTSSSALEVITCEESFTLNDQVYTVSGLYTQILPNAAGCDSTITIDLTLSTVEHPIITVKEFVLGLNMAYSSYQWFLNGELIQGANDSTYFVTENGDYTVIVTNEHGCMDISDIYKVENVVGLSDRNVMAGEISIYPNPSNGVINIQSPVEVNVMIMEMEGKVIRRLEKTQGFSIDDLADGIYMLYITDDAGALYKVEKIVKKGG